MVVPDLNERFSRQVILPGVGPAGQQKLAQSSFLLAGEGSALAAAQTALRSSGAGEIGVLNPNQNASKADLVLVLTENTGWRRELSRHFRKTSRAVLFAWFAGSGVAFFLSRHQGGNCPCLECFETLNPKAFGRANPQAVRLLGALSVSEALQWVLKGESPIEGKVWITSLEEGVSFHHEVKPSYKCPARLLEEGALSSNEL